MLSNPRVRIQHVVQPVRRCCEMDRCHGSPPPLLPVLRCGQLERTKVRAWERQRAHRLARHPPSLCSKLPPPCCRSLLQLNKCTVVQLQPHHQGKQNETKKHTTWPAQHNRPNTPSPALQTAGVSLWLNAPLSTPPWPLAPLPPPADPLHPSSHNGLSLYWQYKWTRVSAYSAAFQKEKERRHQQRIGGSE